MKFIVVTGGTISGLGKGTCASSIGVVLKSRGYVVTAIKIDPYLNVDAGTISPHEHGEVFVLSDGHEGDLDLGNYERALDIKLTKDHNLTTGKIYQTIILAERNGDYLGATVQVVPHVTDCIQQWLLRVSRIKVNYSIQPAANSRLPPEATYGGTGNDGGTEPDICLVEVGGVVGDLESSVYLEALQQFFTRIGRNDSALCHVVYLPIVGEEQKTKPAQHSFRFLREAGLLCDFVFGRCSQVINETTARKLALFSQTPSSNIMSLQDCSNSFQVPQQFIDQGFPDKILKKLDLPPYKYQMSAENMKTHLTVPTPIDIWNIISKRMLPTQERPVVTIGIVAKYTGFNDTYTSVVKSLQLSACEANLTLQLKWINSEDVVDQESAMTLTPAQKEELEALQSVDGILVPGGFGDRGMEGKIAAAKYARLSKKPYFGICVGLQTAVIEGARNLLGLADANSEEWDPDTQHKVVVYMPETANAIMGGTMRLGDRTTFLNDPNCLTRKLYDGAMMIVERHRHRYEVNTEYMEALEKEGFKFVGRDERGARLEILERPDHPFFLAVQYHPEFTTRPQKPNPCFLGFVLASAGLLEERFKANSDKLLSGIQLLSKNS